MRTAIVLAIAALFVGLVVLTKAVVRLENYRYANFLGFCAEFSLRDPQQLIEREKSLNGVQTRTHWFWHVVHGIGLL